MSFFRQDISSRLAMLYEQTCDAESGHGAGTCGNCGVASLIMGLMRFFVCMRQVTGRGGMDKPDCQVVAGWLEELRAK